MIIVLNYLIYHIILVYDYFITSLCCTPGTSTEEELEAEESVEDSKETTKDDAVIKKNDESDLPETGCPSPDEVSCTEGELCSKHRDCGEDTICCPNKCYRKRCTPGTATDAELAAEESDEESEELQNKSNEAKILIKKKGNLETLTRPSHIRRTRVPKPINPRTALT